MEPDLLICDYTFRGRQTELALHDQRRVTTQRLFQAAV